MGADESAAKKLALQRENESATTLSRAGYDVEQNPTIPGDKNPDYRVNGKIFDCYAPTTSNVRNIASRMEEKVVDGQTDRIVLNLSDTSADVAAIRTNCMTGRSKDSRRSSPSIDKVRYSTSTRS
ncbi:hypothetical protein [Amycolatopsis rhizosphaerae]|uniref:CdiA C-terminal domain-containing protein n=1 Tax=Amycolatopsis rhizosphaerae TaxID=2053003 RepID=UPI001C93ADAC